MTPVGQFAEIIETGRARYGGNITNWGRDPLHNHDVGGHRDSLHMSGLAVDLWFHTPQNANECADFYIRQGLWIKWMTQGRSFHVQALDPSTRNPDL